MSFPLRTRAMLPSERNMVLSDWKKELHMLKHKNQWSSGLRYADFWQLLNHVLDHVTLPSCEVVMGCHASDATIPLCWAALRDGKILMMYARGSVQEDRELSYNLDREFRKALGGPILVPFNPFQELKT